MEHSVVTSITFHGMYLANVREEIKYLRTDPLHKTTHFRLSIMSVIINCRKKLVSVFACTQTQKQSILKLH